MTPESRVRKLARRLLEDARQLTVLAEERDDDELREAAIHATQACAVVMSKVPPPRGTPFRRKETT